MPLPSPPLVGATLALQGWFTGSSKIPAGVAAAVAPSGPRGTAGQDRAAQGRAEQGCVSTIVCLGPEGNLKGTIRDNQRQSETGPWSLDRRPHRIGTALRCCCPAIFFFLGKNPIADCYEGEGTRPSLPTLRKQQLLEDSRQG